ncbi:hypothetical protein K493DRAFT_387455 [Basidiobolus meristosporus CBS 931.73]|uniref:Uncharacterized protein n=1 Tax=Basidiobolus meristosporus CBS 931.73 TaxID=1314790 RepID=A0A1Y1YVU7_9FUNG|nr:hypothetical protein K493DRAFT_387455 [Basidiobolus meristosporus CBS 931.73]|eukprot:ORY02121.1 hypothetical protein K493DRAFT_387455 [Basidiobolus meristosporus CBS 931.73]
MRLFRQERVSKQRTFIPKSKHELLAHEARDIMTGKRKQFDSGRTIKALQNPDTMNKVLPILRKLPEADTPHAIDLLFTQEPPQPTSTVHFAIKEVRQRIELVNFSPLDAIATNQGPLLSNRSGPPPRDVVSVYTYWWGYEIYLPDQLVKELIKDGNTAVAAAGLIAALSAAVPALAPFVRVISAFITLQIAVIQRKDHNSGIILTSSW